MADWDNDRDADPAHPRFEELVARCSAWRGRGTLVRQRRGGRERAQRQDRPLLLSEEGLARLVAAGELTRAGGGARQASGLPPPQYAHALEWVGLRAMQGLRNGTPAAPPGRGDLLRQFTGLRAEYSIPDDVGPHGARVRPAASARRLLVVLSPFALYPALGLLSIPATGLLTLFFKGPPASEALLDPLGTEALRDRTSASTCS